MPNFQDRCKLIKMSREKPIGIKRGFVDTEWGQVHYRTAGSGSALVLTHKTYFSSRSFGFAGILEILSVAYLKRKRDTLS